jgi:hypothetical protein
MGIDVKAGREKRKKLKEKGKSGKNRKNKGKIYTQKS